MNDKMNINTLFSFESFICPICQDPLLDPVVADDGFMYNKNCFLKYCSHYKHPLSSPMTKEPISDKYTNVFQFRSHVLTFIENSNIFDEWISDLNFDQIIDYRLSDCLVKSTKINLLSNQCKSDLVKHLVKEYFKNNKFAEGIGMLEQYKVYLALDYTQYFISACENNLTDVALKLLDCYPTVEYNFINNSGTNGLIAACKNKMSEVVLKLLTKPNLNISLIDCDGNNIFLLACINKMTEVVLKLLDCYPTVDYNFVNVQSGDCGLIVACKNKMSEVVLKLLTKPNLNMLLTDCDGNDPFLLACINKMTDVGIKIIESPHHVNYNTINSKGVTGLIVCCENRLSALALKLLEKNFIHHNHVCNAGHSALSWACSNVLSEVATALLKKPYIEYNFIDNGEIVLRFACINNLETVVDEFLKKPNLKYNYVSKTDGVTPLIAACNGGNTYIALKLLNIPDIDINNVSNKGNTALKCACRQGIVSVVKKLLRMPNINYNYVNESNGRTALICACENKYEAVALELLEQPGINYDIADKGKNTALSFAKSNNLGKVITAINNLKMSEKYFKGIL